MIGRFLFPLCILASSYVYAQKTNPFGLTIINNVADYKKSVTETPEKQLVELKKFIPELKLDIKYATKNNFAKQAVYKQARAYARLPVAIALKNVQAELNKSSYGLKYLMDTGLTVLLSNFLKSHQIRTLLLTLKMVQGIIGDALLILQ